MVLAALLALSPWGAGRSAAAPEGQMTFAIHVSPAPSCFDPAETQPGVLTLYGTPATGAAWIAPKRSVERVGDDGFKRAPVGAGPYKFVSFAPGIELVLDANETYWRKVPSVKRLVFRAVPDESTRLAMLKRGEADIAYS